MGERRVRGPRWLVRASAAGLALALSAEILAVVVFDAPPVDRRPLVQVEPHPVLGYRLVPRQDTFTYQARVQTDLRGRRVPPRFDAGGARTVLFVGGSETFGKGVKAEETFVYRVGEALGWGAVNAGTPDWSLEQSVRFVEQYAQSYRPSLVVLVFYWDDLFFDGSARAGTSTASAGSPAEVETRGEWFLRRWARQSSLLERVAPLYTRSAALCAVRNGAKEAWGRLADQPAVRWRQALLTGDDAPGLADAWRAAEAELRRLAAWGEQHGVPVVVLVLPMEQQAEVGGFPARARGAAEQAGLPVVDATEAVLEAEAPFLPFDGRPSPAGHAAIARALGEALAGRYQQTP